MKKIIILLIIGVFILITCGGCANNICPTYDSAIRAKKQMKRSAFEAWNSDFCKPPKPRKSKF